jgi:hypothetical protein
MLTLAQQIMALRTPTLAELALLIEAIAHHLEHAPIPSQQHDVYWCLDAARDAAEHVQEDDGVTA